MALNTWDRDDNFISVISRIWFYKVYTPPCMPMFFVGIKVQVSESFPLSSMAWSWCTGWHKSTCHLLPQGQSDDPKIAPAHDGALQVVSAIISAAECVTVVMVIFWASWFFSAGVGRTGTFIALDYLVDRANSEGRVDVYSLVEEMRSRRPCMVQTEVLSIRYYLHWLTSWATNWQKVLLL